MFVQPRRITRASVGAAIVAACLATASCGAQQSSLQQVQSSNPSVTYKYRSDQELVLANQSAMTYCDRYQAVPRSGSFASDPDGSKVVAFECVPTQQAQAPLQQVNSNLVHTYRTDQELLDGSRSAQAHCSSGGSKQMTSAIVANGNGSKTVTFRCSPG